MPQHTTQAIADHLAGVLEGPGDLPITGPSTLDDAGATGLGFVGAARYTEPWARSAAAAAVVRHGLDLPRPQGKALIRVDDVDAAMARVLELFAPPPEPVGPGGVHERAWVDPRATLGAGCTIHAHATVLGPCTLGDRVTLWPGAVIGADGFGYRAGGSGLVKIPHLGGVRIGDDVEVGANTCIDRGKLADTVIGAGTKIDNLCQIGHNCKIGRHVVIAGNCAIAGSVTIGDGVVVGGMTAAKDHVTIGAGARIGGGAVVRRDVPAGVDYAGDPARPLRRALREQAALRRLPEMLKKLRGM